MELEASEKMKEQLNWLRRRPRMASTCTLPFSWRYMPQNALFLPLDNANAWYHHGGYVVIAPENIRLMVVIADNKIYLWWFDKEHCFQSRAIDFITNLPHFIVMIILFQRMKPQDWGISSKFRISPQIRMVSSSFDETPWSLPPPSQTIPHHTYWKFHGRNYAGRTSMLSLRKRRKLEKTGRYLTNCPSS